MLNVVVLMGRMVADPELKYTPSGIAVCSFRIAVDRMVKSETGEKQADFIDIVAWRHSAEFVANYLGKGRVVAIQGRIQTRSWVQPDGQKRFKTEVVADRVQGGFDKPREGGPAQGAASASEPGMAPPEPAPAGGFESDMDYDPFAEE
ncbi:MAG: single-stranded DNA-binding protein [Armatimonadetes bacterium]|nr:single-stranded DNA-binding protein [Armatimonadota bacterium]